MAIALTFNLISQCVSCIELISWDLYPREIVKCEFWSETTSFMTHLWCASPFMQDQEVQRLQFHNLLHRPREEDN